MGLLIGICAVLLVVMVGSVTGNVVLMGRNVTRSFDDIEATFTPKVKGPGENGILYLAEPRDACTALTNKVVGGSKSYFVLIIRGICSFDDKVRRAQNAGFRAAIIYDYEDDSPLVAMGGTPGGVEIHAVFISKVSGTVLKQYAGLTDFELWILPTIEHPTWSIMAISFISLLALSAMVVTCCFVRQHEGNEISRVPQVQEFNGMSCRMVKAMPSLIFTTVLEDTCTSVTCAICLEDYKAGEKLRILPCRHKFHAICVDSWLTSWRTFCPMCKRDARTNIPIPPPSESTPLLSSVSPSPASTILSFHSPIATSPPVPIISTPPWLPSPSSRNHSLSSTHRLTNSYKSCNNSHGIYINRSSADLRNVNSSQRSHTSHFMSPRSVGMPVSSPYGSRYIYPYNPSSSNASPSYLAGSSSRPSYLRHCESGASISALASAQSLPSC